MRAQPLHELDDHGVAPHPCREAPEVGERLDGIGVVTQAAHVPADPVGVGPIRLGRNRDKSFLFDEPLGNLGALAIKLVGAMGRFAEQHESRVAHEIHNPVVVFGGPGQRLQLFVQRLRKGRFSYALHRLSPGLLIRALFSLRSRGSPARFALTDRAPLHP